MGSSGQKTKGPFANICQAYKNQLCATNQRVPLGGCSIIIHRHLPVLQEFNEDWNEGAPDPHGDQLGYGYSGIQAIKRSHPIDGPEDDGGGAGPVEQLQDPVHEQHHQVLGADPLSASKLVYIDFSSNIFYNPCS